MKNFLLKSTLHQGVSLEVDRKHRVQNLPVLTLVNESDWSPSTTTLGELPIVCCPEEKVSFFRATFVGEGEASNIHNITQMNITKHNIK